MNLLHSPKPLNAATKQNVTQIHAKPGPQRGGRKANSIDFAEVKSRAEVWIVDILEEIAPDGELRGSEYFLLNPHRNDLTLNSFKYNIDKHVYSDFAVNNDVKGAGIIDLVVYLEDVSPVEAARKINDIIDKLDQSSSLQTAADGAVKIKAKAKLVKQLTTPVIPVPEDAPPAPNNRTDFGVATTRYTYSDAEDRLVCHVHRFDPPGQRKVYLPQTYRKGEDGKLGWYWLGLGAQRPLYNLRELVTRPDDHVLIVEGEKAANAARSLFPEGVVVTTMGGAQAPDKTDISPLKGRSILLWPDNDDAGMKYIKSLSEMLCKQDPNADISVLRIPDVQAEIIDGQPVLTPRFVAVAGWDAADAVNEGWTAAHMQLYEASSNAKTVEAVEAVEAVDSGYYTSDGSFFVSDEGVFKVIYKDGHELKTKISSKIENIAQSFDDAGHWGFLLAVTNPDGVCREWTMARELLSTPSQWRGALLSMGADIHPSGTTDHLYDYLLNVKPTARVRSVSRPGWAQDTLENRVFVLPDQVIGESPERFVLQGKTADEVKTFGHCGDLVQWQQEVAALCVGNSRLTTAVCVALTGPVLHLMGEENGGFHFVGPSSMGKTTAVEMAASVWGRRNLFVKSWRTTDNALEVLATRHNDTILILDEISQVDPTFAGAISYMLGNGRGKSRADKTGGSRTVLSWRLLFLSTGEKSLAEHMETGKKQALAGQEIRLINLTADAGAGMGLFQNIHGIASAQEFATRIKSATLEFYGGAGPAFVEAISSSTTQSDLILQIQQGTDQFIAANVPADASGQVHRVGRRFGLLAAVGEVAIALGILPWPAGEAIAGARVCFQSWVDGRGGVGNQEAEQAIAQVRRFLELHGESRFTSWNDVWETDPRSRTINRAGFRKVTDDDRTEYYVLPEAYRTEVCAGLNPKQVTAALRDRGFLVIGSDGKSLKQVRLPGLGPKKVYCISPDIFGDAE